ncbi:hypothetical protein HS088_TW09G01036 [Tripterygium wilfordii]|uniref:Uncharacterized protein n=1 Tax=Tripterygium wilfordii TaxID=458696 RepID=A0A7J7D9K9_TRIWF|nr:uncharacterized protein LOC120005663 [Tripterygium wilfordii]KAF5742974.1 hypothetical protein HS088_TW09G01036 [Tripterygium wilfordii]
MPQDSFRSVVYRSFVTCDDPKGVVECGTIRKSKSCVEKLEHKTRSRRKQKKTDAHLAINKPEEEEMTSKGIGVEESCSPSSFQLLEVSRGAQKLNQMSESWCKGPSYERHSKEIAKDLLKGALDLQESLVMLDKLQEASQYKSRLKKKQKEKFEMGRTDEIGIECTNSNRFRDQKYQMGFQSPRLSADGSSKDCYEELRNVIRESFARQNLLSQASAEKESYFRRRNFDLASEIPSTSSSQSSTAYTNNFTSTDSSISSKAPQKQANPPCLIARLMGLGEVPSEHLQTTPQKQMETEKILNQRRLLFDIEMPKAKRPQFVVKKYDPKHKTLNEILETMQFKGLLKSKSVKEFRTHSDPYGDFDFKQSRVDDIAPIVLIKPLHVPHLESEEQFSPASQEEGALNSKKVLRKPKLREVVPPRAINHQDMPVKMPRKTEAEENTVKKTNKDEMPKGRKVVDDKPEEKKVKTKGKSSSKLKVSGPITHEPQKKEPVDKKVDRIQKVKTSSRKAAGKEIVKSAHVSISQDQVNVTAAKPEQLKKASKITKVQTPQQLSSAAPNTSLKPTTKTTIATPKHQKKKKMSASETMPAKSAANYSEFKEDDKGGVLTSECDSPHMRTNAPPALSSVQSDYFECKEDDERGVLTSDYDSPHMRTVAPLADELLSEEVAEPSGCQTKESCSDSQSSIANVTMLTFEHEKEDKDAEENDHINLMKPAVTSLKTGSNLKALLLCSPSFHNHAEELFDTNVSCPREVAASDANDYGVADVNVLLDYANEFIELRSLQNLQTVHPLSKNKVKILKIFTTLDRLVEEINDGFEALRRYREHDEKKLSTEHIYSMLEKDISCKRMMNGMWHLGWDYGFSVEEGDEVVNDIEKLLLTGLLEEVFA